MRRTKAFRRFQKGKKIKKVLSILKIQDTHESNEELLIRAKKQADNVKNIKCECCCNPRHSKLSKDKRTIQEKKAPDINEEE